MGIQHELEKFRRQGAHPTLFCQPAGNVRLPQVRQHGDCRRRVTAAFKKHGSRYVICEIPV